MVSATTKVQKKGEINRMVIVETIVKFAFGWGLSKAVLYVLGFGPLGPISGSIAAIVQSKSKIHSY